MATSTKPVNVLDFECLARERMTAVDFDYVAGGATDEVTLRRTRLAYKAVALRPRVLVGIESVDLSTTVLGTPVALPVMLAPCGNHSMAHPEGELASARAAGSMGALMIAGSHASYTLEDVAAAATGPLWFQTYFFGDRGLTLSLIRRAEEAGYKAICLTLDSFWPSKRERNIRNGFQHKGLGANYTNASQQDHSKVEQGQASGQTARAIVDAKATWKDIQWLKSETELPLVAKGIMTAEDAALCAQHGIEGLIVSNHGARNVDNTLATIEVLPEIVEACQGKLEVFVDGGIRRGADVVKALALGAKAVLIGRPIFWGLAADGEEGLHRILEILKEEMEITLALCGRPTIGSIDASLVTPSPRLS
ncbi:MAG: 4-hydroxymandelate oxidase [Chloroflexi bacterium]|nr:MAG: 4-hydroxymandelate oxidase [Chloroflexota bacterium]